MGRIRPSVMTVASLLLLPTGVSAQTFVWEPVLTGATSPPIGVGGRAHLAPDPDQPDGAWACFGHLPNPAAGPSESDGCWRTDDWGSSWRLLSSDDPAVCPDDGPSDFDTLCRGDDVQDVAVCSSKVLAVAVHEKGFFLSTDGGGSWANVSDGITHDDTGAGHFDSGGSLCLSHPPQDFRERRDAGMPWSGLTVEFDRSDPTCSTLWVGVGDLSGFDLTAGLGDHPGVYLSTDGGESWSERNGGDYDAARADPLACHPLSVISRTAAPASLKVTRSGPIYLHVLDGEFDASPFGVKEGCSQPRVFQLDDGTDLTWSEPSDPVLDAQERCVQTDSFGLSAASLTYGRLTESAAGLDYLALQLENVSVVVGAGLAPTEVHSQGQGIVAGLVATPIRWLERDLGLPSVTDAFNAGAQNVSPVSISPSNLWLVGVSDADGAPPQGGDASFVYVGPNFGSSWLNTRAFTPGGEMFSAPGDPTLTESCVVAAAWNATGQKVLVHTLWCDAYDPLQIPEPVRSVEPDDGLYRACPFAPGGAC